MAEILKVYTPEQLYELARAYVVAKNVGLTNFNEGSRVRTVLEAVAAIESSTGMKYLEGLRRSIPIVLYDGLGFTRKGATTASGYLRFYRLPVFTITYTGTGTSCLLTVTDTDLTTVVTGAVGDDLSLSFGTYTTVSALVAAIHAHPSYTCVLVGTGTGAPSALYDFAAVEIVGALNYLNQSGRDIMFASAGAVVVNSGAQASRDGVIFITLAGTSISAGDSTTPAVLAQAVNTGPGGNLAAQGIDTRNGKGVLTTTISGVDYVVNDSAFSGGQDEETDDERATRFQVHVQGLSRNTSRGIEAAVLEIPEIRSCTVQENVPQRGQLTVVADDGTGTLTVAMTKLINKVLYGDPDDLLNYPGVRPAGVTANVQAPAVVAVNVTVTVFRIGTLSDAAEITANVQTAVENYVNTLKLGRDVIVKEIVRKIMNAHPSVYDVTVTVPAANVGIADDSVARTGSGTGGTVTVNLTTLPELP